MPKTLILIPPSEGKNSGGNQPPLKTVSQPVKIMIQNLQSFSGDLEKLLGVKGQALLKAKQTNQHILENPTLPAIERYSGVVYKVIDYPSLSTQSKKFFNNHIRIISALFGLVSPLDLIPDYKLKIDKLTAQKFWDNILTPQIQNSFCFNLLPQTHQKAITPSKQLCVNFIIKKQGKILSTGHKGKHIKGRFIRWLCQNQITNPDDLAGFQEKGYRWTGECFINQ